MLPTPDSCTTSILLIDDSQSQRTYWADQLKCASPDYLIVEAEDRESGLALYRSRKFSCVILELALPDQAGFQLFGVGSGPQQAAGGCDRADPHDTAWAEDLDRAIQRAMAFVGQMPNDAR